MPQLMPLNWMISGILVLLMIISSCIIFSEKALIDEVMKMGLKEYYNSNKWWW